MAWESKNESDIRLRFPYFPFYSGLSLPFIPVLHAPASMFAVPNIFFQVFCLEQCVMSVICISASHSANHLLPLVDEVQGFSLLEPLRLFDVFADHFHLSSRFTSQTSVFRFSPSSFTYVCCLWGDGREGDTVHGKNTHFLTSVFFPFRLVFESLLTAYKRMGRREKDHWGYPQWSSTNPAHMCCLFTLPERGEVRSLLLSDPYRKRPFFSLTRTSQPPWC